MRALKLRQQDVQVKQKQFGPPNRSLKITSSQSVSDSKWDSSPSTPLLPQKKRHSKVVSYPEETVTLTFCLLFVFPFQKDIKLFVDKMPLDGHQSKTTKWRAQVSVWVCVANWLSQLHTRPTASTGERVRLSGVQTESRTEALLHKQHGEDWHRGHQGIMGRETRPLDGHWWQLPEALRENSDHGHRPPRQEKDFVSAEAAEESVCQRRTNTPVTARN